MIHLLFTLILAEMALVLTLTFRTPVRKLVIMGLDQLKKGRGLVMMQTVAGTMLVVFASIIHSIMKVQKRLMDAGSVNPTDQVLMANHLLEGSLMGFSLFLALVIDRLHYYIKELHLLRTSLEAVRQGLRGGNICLEEIEIQNKAERDKGCRGQHGGSEGNNPEEHIS